MTLIPPVKGPSPVQGVEAVKVLIADDDRRVAKIVRSVLEALGFTSVFMATSGAQALQIIQSERIDFVITDWRMSPGDGVSLIKFLRTSYESPNPYIPIIMLTAHSERHHVEFARDIGVTEFVIKPFSAKILCDRIRSIIENPRSFVMSKHYSGPDRRRRSATPPDGNEKRKT